MIQGREFENRVMISSIELYQAMGRPKEKYTDWIRMAILNKISLDNPRDYFLFRKHITGAKGSPREYYFSITLAKCVCIQENTIIAKKIRRFIEEEIERPAGKGQI